MQDLDRRADRVVALGFGESVYVAARAELVSGTEGAKLMWILVLKDPMSESFVIERRIWKLESMSCHAASFPPVRLNK